MLPFELPLWIDEKYTNENSIYCNRTYRYIVELFFNKKKTIYHTIKYNNIGYIEHTGGTSFAFSNRTTYLLYLIELIDDNNIKYIFKLFLEYTQDINFYHPSSAYNSLIILKKMLKNNKHTDIMDLLLRRKEIIIPDVITFLSECIQEGKHILTVLDIFNRPTSPSKKCIYYIMLSNYLNTEQVKSKKIISKLVERSRAGFEDFIEIFFNMCEIKPAYIDFVALVPWNKFLFFKKFVLSSKINLLFCKELNYIENSHGLFAIYNIFLKNYNIHVDIPCHIEESLIFYHRKPEQLLLMDRMKKLEKYKALLPDKHPVLRFLNTRYKIKYGKYFWFWVHRVYRPGSKFYYKLLVKYSNIMPSTKNTNETSDDIQEENEEVPICINTFKNILKIHPYRKSEFEINCN